MSKLLFPLLLLLFSMNGYAQRDSVFLKDGRSYRAEILRNDTNSVDVRLISKNEYIAVTILKSDIKTLKYDAIKPYQWNIGLGYGPSYGGVFGCHTLLGKNNHGLILGLGYSPYGFISPSAGLQAAGRWFFVNIGVGPFGVFRRNDDPFKLAYGIYGNIGGMINLDKNKLFYLEIGLGTAAKLTTINRYNNEPFDYYHYTGSLGIGYRLGRK